ncbi:comEA protein [Enterococcus sp. JM4C]|uniref:helix-hairpin-helix domain-containing protein n=1 Tax=Candidatus Enterococcus huntleyi TaxID=1857217 RepID=UPI001379BE44|nr:helix-hairpin-helix domain-containing protein [Enterococcus sp. JM4C]KAF1296897.1 comEA protein [Enterococcus sp. JM4C]
MKKRLVENYRLLVISIIIVLIIGGGVYHLLTQNLQDKTEDPFSQESFQSSPTAEETIQEAEKTSETSMGPSYVNIKGAVQMPGVYQITEGDRLQDVVGQAGGYTKEADDRQINLSAKVTDQQLIYIPKKGEQVAQETSDSATASGKTAEDRTKDTGEKVNLNTADRTQLQTLTGIGEKKADEIISYREENGHFKTINELTKVSGIGEKTVEKLANSITI